VAVTVQVPPQTAPSGSHPMVFEVASQQDASVRVTEKSVFIIPR
jgi:hypothetical protein